MPRYGAVRHRVGISCILFPRRLLLRYPPCFFFPWLCAAESLTLLLYVLTPQAACLRAARLGEITVEEAAEIDMRLAAIAERYGRPSAAVRLYFRMMASPATNENGR